MFDWRRALAGFLTQHLAGPLGFEVVTAADASKERAYIGEAVRDLDELCSDHELALARAEQAERALRDLRNGVGMPEAAE